ncbi:MAG: glutathione S-transferase family protein [Alphaproteobacteria bacterium]|nr:glutathione S-transferase family protein [Alphaproteobacteria bacterium]
MAPKLEVYWFSGSGTCWRVLLTLELKGLPYRSRLLQVSKGELKSPEFLDINPRGQVPALRNGDYALSESLAIMAYLDAMAPEPPLFGRSAEETGHIWRTVLDFEFQVMPVMLRVILPIFLGQIEEKAADVRAAATELTPELVRLDASLAGRAWLVGDGVSAADIAIYPLVEALLRAAAKPEAAPLALDLLPFVETFPALEAWRARIAGLPGYDNAYPPHWREAA